jgi:hypothetical protein
MWHKGTFASLNALCLPRGELKSTDWGGVSEKNHAATAEAYRKWWRSYASRPADEARKADPLEGTDLRWF